MKKKKLPAMKIGSRWVGSDHAPLVIAEIGINHEGSFAKAKRMVDDAWKAGAECVKFQSHVIEDEMVPAAKNVIPGNAQESIWNIMERCALTEKEERDLKKYVESKGMIYLSTPFSRAAADRLKSLGVVAYKIGSGECNNYPLIDHIASFGKPIILSTGMNDVASVRRAVQIFRKRKVPYALLHCTSLYPTPYSLVRLGGMTQLQSAFPDSIVGLSDHSLGNYTCFGATALGACILEKHFTSDKSWPGPDVSISIDPTELRDLIEGSRAVSESRGGEKKILKDETPTIRFAYASVVAIKPIAKGEKFTKKNVWVKRPGTGQILAVDFEKVLGKKAVRSIPEHAQIKRNDVHGFAAKKRA
jgi:N-acetylneuraminate synthase